MEHLDLDEGERAPMVSEADGRSRTSAANGKNGGNPKGAQHRDKRTYRPDALAEGLADRIIAGRGIPLSPLARAGPVTEQDRSHIARITGIPAEEFQAMISAKLQIIADKTASRVLEKLDGDEQKLSDLNMTLAISIDKLAAISGRTAQSGNVSVTVNNYGQMTREQMMAEVAKDAKPIIEV